MSDNYWVRHQGRSLGPYTLDRVRQMIRQGQVGRAQEVSTDGVNWASIMSFPEVFERPAAGPQTATTTASGEPAGDVRSGGSPPAEAQWYCAVNGVQQGPMPRSQLLSLVHGGRLSAADLVFREGMADWAVAGDVPELASAFTAAATGPAQRGPGQDAFCRECGAPLSAKARMCPKCGAPTGMAEFPPPDAPPRGRGIDDFSNDGRRREPRHGEPKSKVVAAILALVLGGLGVHHFYLGNATLGVCYLLFFWTFIPAVIAFVEAIVFLTMSDAAFDDKYN